MPSSVEDLMWVAGVREHRMVPWGGTVPELNPGVFLVATTEDPGKLWDDSDGAWKECICCEATADLWLDCRPELRMDGRRPTPDELWRRLSEFWLGDEVVLHAGGGESLRDAVEVLYATPIGGPSECPDPGVHWAKALGDSNAGHLSIHFGAVDDPGPAVEAVLEEFAANVSPPARALLRDRARPLPFANTVGPGWRRKRHGLTGMSGPL